MSFVVDTFTGVDGTALDAHTGETGATWTKVVADTTGSGAWIFGGYCMENGGSHGHYEASGAPATAEYDITVVYFVKTNLGNTGHLGRKQAGAITFYGAFFSGTDMILYKCVAGTYTQIGAYTFNPTVNTTYTVKLQIRDAAKKVFIDGVERISSADNSITGAGKAAIRLDNANFGSNTGIWATSFNADDVASGPVNTVAPAVTGTAAVGSTLSCSTGTWTGDVSSGYAYQWQRDNSGGGSYSNIGGATASTHVVVSADAGCQVRCVVTATGTGGSTSANSNAVSIPAAPVNSVAPAVTDTPAVGATLTSDHGTFTGDVSVGYAYQWQRETAAGSGTFSNIGGATASTHVVVTADRTLKLRCVVTATGTGGPTSANSNQAGPAGTYTASFTVGMIWAVEIITEARIRVAAGVRRIRNGLGLGL